MKGNQSSHSVQTPADSQSRISADPPDPVRPFRIAGIGEILWDIFPDQRCLGGAPANFACHAARLGADSWIVSAVGTDELGQEALSILDRMGVHRDALAVLPDFPSGTVSIELTDGQPSFTIHQGVAWDCLPWNPELAALAKRLDAVCFGSLGQRTATSRTNIQRFLATVPPSCLRVFDINLRQQWYSREIIETSLAFTDVLKLNDDELPILAELLALPGSGDAMLQRLIDRASLRLLVLTRGANGSILRTPQKRVEHPGIPTKVVDAVGAGDAFTAAVTMGLLRGDTLEKINVDANQLGAYVAAHTGAVPGKNP